MPPCENENLCQLSAHYATQMKSPDDSPISSSQFRILEDADAIRSEIVDQIDVFLCDMDGVLWDGTSAIPGVTEAIAALHKKKELFFVTNNSIRTRKSYGELLASRGFQSVGEENIYGSAYAMAKYLKSINFDGKAYVIGNDAMVEEMKQMGVNVHDISSTTNNRSMSPMEFADEPIDYDVGAVIIGCDPDISYYKLCYATSILQAKPDCLFLATNKDLWFFLKPNDQATAQERRIPGTGTFVGVLEITSKREAFVVGKPSSFIFEDIMKKCNTTPSRICMIGDNLLTDVAFGKANGMKTVLVETGVHRRGDIGTPGLEVVPDFVIPSLAKLLP